MSRTVTSFGAPGVGWPASAEFVRTYELAVTHNALAPQGGMPWERFPHPLFGWHYSNSSTAPLPGGETDPRRHVLPVPDGSGGEYDTVFRLARGEHEHLVINNEMSILLERWQWENAGLDDLVQVMPGEGANADFIRLTTRRTPAAEEDNWRSGAFTAMTIEAVDETAQTITLTGQQYYRNQASTKTRGDGLPLYHHGSHWGFDRYNRDELDSDATGPLDQFKQTQYAHAFFKFGNDFIRYSSVVDSPERDRRRSDATSYPADTDYGASTHVLTILDWPAGGFSVGDKIYPQKRLPWAATMLATQYDFSQIGGFWDYRVRLHSKRHQFSSIFFWSAFLQYSLLEVAQKFKEVEFDGVEYPAGSTLYFNHHRPEGGRDRDSVTGVYPHSMYDYAATSKQAPGSAEYGPEWSEVAKEQHLTLVGASDPRHIDPTDWADFRLVIWPEGNEYGMPSNVVQWFGAQKDQPMMLLASCLISPEAAGDVIPALQGYFCNPAGGNFAAGATYYTGTGEFGASAVDDGEIHLDIEHIYASQFVGGLPGGEGAVDGRGDMPNGFRASASDPTGNSGTGVVQPADASSVWLGMPRFVEAVPAGGNAVTVAFELPIEAAGVTGYEIESDGVRVASVATDGTHTVTGLSPGLQRLRVRAVGANGARSYYRSTPVTVEGAATATPDVESPEAEFAVEDDRCAPLRLSTTNHVATSTLVAVPDPVTPLDAIKNEYRSRFARWTTLDENGEITIDVAFGEDVPVEYVALPGWTLPGTTEIKLDLFDAAGDPIAGYVARYQTLASLLPLGVWRAGIDPYGGVDPKTTPGVYVDWLSESHIARSARLTLRTNDAGTTDVRARMLLMGEKLEFETNFDYGGGLSYMTPPRLIELASGSVIPSRAQKRSRRMSLVFDHMTGFDRSRLSDMEVGLAGKPFLVSAHPKRSGWQYRDYNFLARFEPALVYVNAYEDRHEVRNFILREV